MEQWSPSFGALRAVGVSNQNAARDLVGVGQSVSSARARVKKLMNN